MSSGLTACQTTLSTAPDAVSQDAQSEPPPVMSAADEAQIQQLLAQAQDAMTRDHLSYPAHGSALTLFDAVRAIDPANGDAQRGLEDLVERYVDKAERAANQGQLAHARSMLDRARIVDPEHPALVPSERRLALLDSAKRHRLRIHALDLHSKTAGLVATLQELGGQARADNCRSIIRVSSDSDGRWVYQQMSSGPGTQRIRAEVQIGMPPRVDVLCFQQKH